MINENELKMLIDDRSVGNSERLLHALMEMQAVLRKSEELFQGITSNLPGVVFQFLLSDNRQISFPFVSDASETLLGLSPQKLMDCPELFPLNCFPI